MLKRKKIIIIDGYNVLRNGHRYANLAGISPDFRDWTSDAWNAAREALLDDVFRLIDSDSQAIIVYDAAQRYRDFNESEPPQQLKNVKVIFTDKGESADTRIQKLVFASREKGMNVEVITSDFAIQNATMHEGVVRTSSRAFQNNLTENERAEQSINKPIDNPHLIDVLDLETAAKLKALRDSL